MSYNRQLLKMASENISVNAEDLNFDSIEKFRSYEDKFDSLFTIIIHSLSGDELLSKLKQHTNNCKAIANGNKKNYILKKMYDLVEYAKEKRGIKCINCIILFNDKANVFNLDENQVNILIEYDIEKYSF